MYAYQTLFLNDTFMDFDHFLKRVRNVVILMLLLIYIIYLFIFIFLVHDLQPFGVKVFNMSHRIRKLSFGTEFPGVVNPLDNHTTVDSQSQQGRATLTCTCTMYMYRYHHVYVHVQWNT